MQIYNDFIKLNPGYETVMFLKFPSFFMAYVPYAQKKITSTKCTKVLKQLLEKYNELKDKEHLHIDDFKRY